MTSLQKGLRANGWSPKRSIILDDSRDKIWNTTEAGTNLLQITQYMPFPEPEATADEVGVAADVAVGYHLLVGRSTEHSDFVPLWKCIAGVMESAFASCVMPSEVIATATRSSAAVHLLSTQGALDVAVASLAAAADFASPLAAPMVVGLRGGITLLQHQPRSVAMVSGVVPEYMSHVDVRPFLQEYIRRNVNSLPITASSLHKYPPPNSSISADLQSQRARYYQDLLSAQPEASLIDPAGAAAAVDAAASPRVSATSGSSSSGSIDAGALARATLGAALENGASAPGTPSADLRLAADPEGGRVTDPLDRHPSPGAAQLLSPTPSAGRVNLASLSPSTSRRGPKQPDL